MPRTCWLQTGACYCGAELLCAISRGAGSQTERVIVVRSYLLPLASISIDKCTHGDQFAKWRTVFRIDVAKNSPTNYAIDEVAHGLARYTHICQEDGPVSVVKSEIPIDRIHDIETTVVVQDWVMSITY